MKNKNIFIYNNSASKILNKVQVGSLPGNIYSYLNCDYILEDIMWKLKNKNFTNPTLKLSKNLSQKIRLICWTTEVYHNQLCPITRTLGMKFKTKNE